MRYIIHVIGIWENNVVRPTLYFTPRLMFGSLRSLWIFVDPTSDKPNIIEDDFTYDDAENEIIMLTNTEETIPAGMRYNKKKRKGKNCQKYFCVFFNKKCRI